MLCLTSCSNIEAAVVAVGVVCMVAGDTATVEKRLV